MTHALFDPELAARYTSASQRIRVLSERWTQKYLYCPNCGKEPLRKAENNQPVFDFSCPRCAEVFELKSKHGKFGRKLTDGAYSTMIRRLADRDSPSLFLMSYRGQPPQVVSFTVVPRQFLIPSLVERRRPLAPTARRAGWVGCNILLDGIPEVGRITLYEAGCFRPKADVGSLWQRTTFLRDQESIKAQGWLVHVMKGIETLGQETFSLADAYRLEDRLQAAYPRNNHVRPKIRQQLQCLRDAGYLEFLGKGLYRVSRHGAAASLGGVAQAWLGS